MSYWLWYMSLFSYKCWKRVLQRTERCKSLLVPAGGEVWLRHIWLQEPHHPPTAHYSAPSTDIWTSLGNGICGFSKLLAPWQTSNDAWSIIMTQWSLAFFLIIIGNGLQGMASSFYCLSWCCTQADSVFNVLHVTAWLAGRIAGYNVWA